MSTVPHLVTERSLTFFVDGTPYQVDREATQFPQIVAELNKVQPDQDTLVELADLSRRVVNTLAAAVEEYKDSDVPVVQQYLTKGVIKVDRNGVTFNGEEIKNALADRLLAVLSAGIRLGPWIRFAENVYQNPAEYSRDELMLWLEKSDLPITEDGCFLAYKIVGHDFMDLYSHKFDNSPGKVVALEGRQSVDPIRAKTCSYGLHFCSKSYLPSYGGYSGDNKVVLVKINPADVVSIPADHNNAKGRCWRYEVLEEVVDRESIKSKEWAPVASTFAEPEIGPETEAQPDPAVAIREELEGKNIVVLRSLAAAFREAGLSNWIWKVATAPALRDYIVRKRVALAQG